MKKKVFVIMPFSKSPTRDKIDLTSFYENNIKIPIEKINKVGTEFTVCRSDDTFNITKQIIKDLFNADYVVCDLSGLEGNPNVLYELGVRLSISNKPVILIREANVDNRKIFDIHNFFIFEYSAHRYPELESYLSEKIIKLETKEEIFVSPIFEIIKEEPQVLNRILKIENINRLANARTTVNGWRRIFAISVTVFAYGQNKEIQFNGDINDFNTELVKYQKELKELDWNLFKFSCKSSPVFDILITQPPTIEIFPHQELSIFKTFLIEFYNFFFISDFVWNKPDFGIITIFANETLILFESLAILVAYFRDDLDIDKEKVISNFHYVLSQSHFLTDIYGKDNWENYVQKKTRKPKRGKK
jgi:hypothetical protein